MHNESNAGNLKIFNELRPKVANQKILVGFGDRDFIDYTKFEKMKENFAASLVEKLLLYEIDGVDLKWFKYDSTSNNSADSFIEFAEAIKKAFVKSNKHLILTAAMPIIPTGQGYGFSNMSRVFDFFNVMTNNIESNYDGHAFAASPLYGSNGLNINASLKYLSENGIPKEQLVVGIPFFGLSFLLASPSEHIIGSKTIGWGNEGTCGNKAVGAAQGSNSGVLSYFKVCNITNNWARNFSDVEKVPYAYDGNRMIVYEDSNSIKIKVEHVEQECYGGVMVWSVEQDDLNNTCGHGHSILLETVGKKSSSNICSFNAIMIVIPLFASMKHFMI